MNESVHDIAGMLPHLGPDSDQSRLMLFALRRMAAGGLNDAHAAHALLGAFGLGFRRPLILLRALMAEISRASVRKIMVAPCCCPRMTDSEAAIVGAVKVSNHDPLAAHAALCGLLGVDRALGALSSAQAVAQAFADLGRPIEAV